MTLIKVWFLFALMSYPGVPAISYKGFGGYLNVEECEEKALTVKDGIHLFEQGFSREYYIETYCVEMKAFENTVKKQGLGI
tara:strand:+ start:2606 stop:2848 length:243 start_codon:yes stop_codon:yes gene_type:complete